MAIETFMSDFVLWHVVSPLRGTWRLFICHSDGQVYLEQVPRLYSVGNLNPCLEVCLWLLVLPVLPWKCLCSVQYPHVLEQNFMPWYQVDYPRRLYMTTTPMDLQSLIPIYICMENGLYMSFFYWISQIIRNFLNPGLHAFV